MTDEPGQSGLQSKMRRDSYVSISRTGIILFKSVNLVFI